ncbi:enoyl-CoA hydratase/carnithine racemase [Rhodobium orientis]|uniref:Enoyl-CoA hydratase n=1 Tax=Rhodobium orientis TaxID=34017 RepID=A0A327JLB9_9HYPH|nr:crotonase/enoyl-CoA hydratase family protein [Rhodobium orientis]MBB4303895.1 enoyl-CoA hydratase/carnithine racemase [Rhodobium orientis]MBK5951440.1 enoyl-CoA hydratase [Rhodobium orientis]RAI26164.1 enoyl-CoA hydratase [Rhodobium orientis]
MTEHIRIDREAGVQRLRLDRPEKKNAITNAMYETLTEALRTGEQDEAVRVHLLAGVPGAFTAGNDIEDFLSFAEEGALGEAVIHFLKTLATVDKPMIAAVDGLAIGIGTTMLMHCDLVYASPNSVFRTPFLDLGLVPEAASSLLAPRLLGLPRAFELLCLGATFDAEQAHAAGLVNAVVRSDDVETQAFAAARELAAKPQAALTAARRLLRGDPMDVIARIEEEADLFRERLRSEEARTAFHSFLSGKPG